MRLQTPKDQPQILEDKICSNSRFWTICIDSVDLSSVKVMQVRILLTVEVDENLYVETKGIPVSETPDNLADAFALMGDALTWHVERSEVLKTSDVVQT